MTMIMKGYREVFFCK